MSACKLVLVICLLALAAAAAAEPAKTGRSEPSTAVREVFLAGDTCALSGTLDVVVEDRALRARVPKGTWLEVTTSGARFSAVRAGAIGGMVENEALARVCKIERPTCLVSAPLELRGVGKPTHDGETFQLQRGGTLRLLQHDDEQARVRVGQLDAVLALPALLAACPSLTSVLIEEKEAREPVPTATARPPAKP